MNLGDRFIVCLVVVFILSYGAGLIVGGPVRAKWIVGWELDQLLRLMRLVLAHLFLFLSEWCKRVAEFLHRL